MILQQSLPCVGHVGRVNTCKFLDKQTVDSGYFVSGGADGVVRLWNFSQKTGTTPLLLHSFKGGHASGDVLDVSCGSGAIRIASVGVDKAVSLWDVSSGGLWGRLHGHEGKVNCCCFKDGTLLATGSSDGSLRLWDTRSKAAVQILPRFRDSVTGAFIDECSIVGCSVDGSVRSFDVRSGKVDLDQIGFALGCISLSRDGKCAIASCVTDNASLKLLERSTGKTLRSFTGHVNNTVSISTCLDNEDARVGSGSEDGVVRFWDIVSGAIVLQVDVGGMVLGISHHNLQSSFVVCGTNGLLKCFTYR